MADNVEYVLSLKDLLTGKLNEANAAANRLEGSMSGVQSILGALGVAGGIAGVVAFGKSVVEAGTKVEDARVGLTTLLKDANEASGVIKNTMEDATKTPFAFEGLLAANKALISAGVNSKQAREDVLNLANAIAATGGGDVELQRMVVNMQQIKNSGKATLADIKQFAYAGVNIYKVIADATGEPIEKVKEMGVSYETLTYALKKAHDEGGIYAGGLENMAGNTSVQISNLGDAVFQLSVKVFDDLKPAIEGVIGVLKASIDFVSEHGTLFKGLAITLTGVVAGYTAYNGLLAINTVRTGLSTVATFASMVATDGLAAALYAAGVSGATAWALIGGGIGIIVAGIYAAWQNSEKFRGVVYGVWEVVKTVAPMIGNAFMGLGKMIMGVLIPNPKMIKEGWEQLTTAFEGAGKKIGASWEKGYSSGLGSLGDGKIVPEPIIDNKGGGVKPTGSVAPKGATGTKAVTVNISIGKMIENFKISTTNLQESTSKVQEAVANVMLQAVNDSQIVAGI